MYAVIICYNCGRLLLTKIAQKSRQCPHCGVQLVVARTKHVAQATSAHEASRLIRALKQKREALA